MAKGRSLTISRSDRFLESFKYTENNHQTDNNIEFGEDEVWSMVDNMSDWSSRATMEVPTGIPPSAGVLSPGSSGGLSVAFDDRHEKMVRIVHRKGGSMASRRHAASSAPVNVPDWSKIYRVDSVESMHDSDDGIDDQDSDMVPPHEYLARSHRSAAKSVFEGVGRTLKGRDMSRVRDAVWSQTGFDG